MVDTPLLEQRIKDSGKKYGYLAEKLGISRQYFRMKCKNKADFTNRETDILCSELGITSLTENRQSRKECRIYADFSILFVTNV